MKKATGVFLCGCLLLFACSCGPGQETSGGGGPADNIDLKDYLQAASLPENLSVDFDPSAVSSVPTAKAYAVDYLQFDKDAVVQALFSDKNAVRDTKLHAAGPCWYSGSDLNHASDILYLLDGGKSFRGTAGMGYNGGINYSRHLSFPQAPRTGYFIDQLSSGGADRHEYDCTLNDQFHAKKDLSFLGYAAALSKVEDTLASAGFPKLALAESCSLDLATLQASEEIARKTDGSEEAITFSEKDEAYYFVFRQVVDGLPLASVDWQSVQYMSADGDPGVTAVEVKMSADGIYSVYSYSLYRIGEPEEGKKLLTAAQAMDKILQPYKGIMLGNQTSLASLELEYVSSRDGDTIKIIPAWVCHIVTKMEADVSGVSYTYYKNSFYVVDAVTGARREKYGNGTSRQAASPAGAASSN